jgi:hypothetical protein
MHQNILITQSNDKGKKEKEESMRKIYSESKVETLKEYGSINLCSWYIRLDVSAYLSGKLIH